MRSLVAIPVYNEEKYVRRVLGRVLDFAPEVLIVDDGSTDKTPEIVAEFPVKSIRREGNQGYGQSLRDAFRYACEHGYDWLITMDCDEQHEPASIPAFIEAAEADDADIISGSRYLKTGEGADTPPPDRRAINAEITAELNRRLGLNLTDGFCGFKGHRVSALREMKLTENGYAFPMQFWVQVRALGLRVREIPVSLIYNDQSRSFGGQLDNPDTRLAHYRRVLHCELEKWSHRLPASALEGVAAGCS